MKHGLFSVLEWGDYVRDGQKNARFVTLEGLSKGQDRGQRVVANEFACGLLAFVLGLPCPVGEVIHDKVDGVFSSFYVMMKFGKLGERPAPANLRELATDDQELYCGIVAFDAWVMNEDRHERNLAYLRGGKQPAMLFDHEHTLGGRYRQDISSLPSPRDIPGGIFVMRAEVTSADSLDLWAERIRTVARSHLPLVQRRLVDEGLLNRTEAATICAWLDARSALLSDLLRRMFPNLEWRL